MKLYRKWGFLAIFCIYFLFANITTALALAGNGSKESPYLIGSYSDWKSYCGKISSSKTVYAKLTADIDLSTKPSRYTKDMKGILDGCGYKITGLKEPLYNTLCGAEIRNIVIEDCMLNETNTIGAGAIARFSTDALVIENCMISGSVTAENKTGAVIGSVTGNALFANIITSADVKTSNSPQDASAGGILGSVSGVFDIRIENCITMGSVTGTGAFAGGIVGSDDNANSASVLEIVNTAALLGNVSGKNNQSGKIYGGGNHIVNITATNVYTYDGMACTDNSFNNTNNFKYHGTAEITRTECKRASFWNMLFADNADWSISNGRLPILRTTDGDIMQEAEIGEYLQHLFTIDTNSVIIENADSGNLLILAQYSQNRLKDIKTITLTGDTTKTISDYLTVEDGDTVRIMLWDSLASMIALSDAVDISPENVPQMANFNSLNAITFNTQTNEYEVCIDTIW